MPSTRAFISPVSICITLVSSLIIVFVCLSFRPMPTVEASSSPVTVFSNPALVNPADRASNGAGTNPGIPPAPVYPSTINVAGLTGSVSKVTVSFAITSTFPDDFDILLVGPTGARSLVISDAGGSGDHTNVTYTFDQTAATAFPDGGTTVIPTGTYRPANYIGLATPEPGGQDNFPTPGPGLMAYTADFNVFNGTNPNGAWGLYVVDDQQIDVMSLPGGWSIDITTAVAADAPMDYNGDGRSDYVVVRNTGGGPSGQITWFLNNGTTFTQANWGIATDFFVMEDFDGDNKDDIAVWRPGAPGASNFYIVESIGNTIRIDTFGQSGDDPTVVGDYDGDGKADVAVYRAGAMAGAGSTWFYRGSLTPANITYILWGQNGDFPSPGDYDGDAKFDFVIQRNAGGGQARFWRRFASGTQDSLIFGTPTDVIVPGDYDGDGKCDIATVRGVSGNIQWHYLSSINSSINYITFGVSATDFPVQGDFDGDGRVGPAIWRPNIDPTMCFFITYNVASGAISFQEWGQNGDYPVGNFNSH